jgi:hypothetical protein
MSYQPIMPADRFDLGVQSRESLTLKGDRRVEGQR